MLIISFYRKASSHAICGAPIRAEYASAQQSASSDSRSLLSVCSEHLDAIKGQLHMSIVQILCHSAPCPAAIAIEMTLQRALISRGALTLRTDNTSHKPTQAMQFNSHQYTAGMAATYQSEPYGVPCSQEASSFSALVWIRGRKIGFS